MASNFLHLGEIETPYGKLKLRYNIARHWFQLGPEFGVVKIDGEPTTINFAAVIYTHTKSPKFVTSVYGPPALQERVKKEMTPILKRIVKEHRRKGERASWLRELGQVQKLRDRAQKDVELYQDMLTKIEAELAAIPED